MLKLYNTSKEITTRIAIWISVFYEKIYGFYECLKFLSFICLIIIINLLFFLLFHMLKQNTFYMFFLFQNIFKYLNLIALVL